MDIQSSTAAGVMRLALTGRLDSNTAPRLDEALKALDASTAIELDFSALSYLSSAGLRVLLSAQKRAAAAGGSLRIHGVIESIMEVFEMTGFADILNLG